MDADQVRSAAGLLPVLGRDGAVLGVLGGAEPGPVLVAQVVLVLLAELRGLRTELAVAVGRGARGLLLRRGVRTAQPVLRGVVDRLALTVLLALVVLLALAVLLGLAVLLLTLAVLLVLAVLRSPVDRALAEPIVAEAAILDLPRGAVLVASGVPGGHATGDPGPRTRGGRGPGAPIATGVQAGAVVAHGAVLAAGQVVPDGTVVRRTAVTIDGSALVLHVALRITDHVGVVGGGADPQTGLGVARIETLALPTLGPLGPGVGDIAVTTGGIPSIDAVAVEIPLLGTALVDTAVLNDTAVLTDRAALQTVLTRSAVHGPIVAEPAILGPLIAAVLVVARGAGGGSTADDTGTGTRRSGGPDATTGAVVLAVTTLEALAPVVDTLAPTVETLVADTVGTEPGIVTTVTALIHGALIQPAVAGIGPETVPADTVVTDPVVPDGAFSGPLGAEPAIVGPLIAAVVVVAGGPGGGSPADGAGTGALRSGGPDAGAVAVVLAVTTLEVVTTLEALVAVDAALINTALINAALVQAAVTVAGIGLEVALPDGAVGSSVVAEPAILGLLIAAVLVVARGTGGGSTADDTGTGARGGRGPGTRAGTIVPARALVVHALCVVDRATLVLAAVLQVTLRITDHVGVVGGGADPSAVLAVTTGVAVTTDLAVTTGVLGTSIVAELGPIVAAVLTATRGPGGSGTTGGAGSRSTRGPGIPAGPLLGDAVVLAGQVVLPGLAPVTALGVGTRRVAAVLGAGHGLTAAVGLGAVGRALIGTILRAVLVATGRRRGGSPTHDTGPGAHRGRGPGAGAGAIGVAVPVVRGPAVAGGRGVALDGAVGALVRMVGAVRAAAGRGGAIGASVGVGAITELALPGDRSVRAVLLLLPGTCGTGGAGGACGSRCAGRAGGGAVLRIRGVGIHAVRLGELRLHRGAVLLHGGALLVGLGTATLGGDPLLLGLLGLALGLEPGLIRLQLALAGGEIALLDLLLLGLGLFAHLRGALSVRRLLGLAASAGAACTQRDDQDDQEDHHDGDHDDDGERAVGHGRSLPLFPGPSGSAMSAGCPLIPPEDVSVVTLSTQSVVFTPVMHRFLPPVR